jgi:CheY-like chemotaxis protein
MRDLSLEATIKALAEKYYQVYREMTGNTAQGMDIERISPPYSLVRYQLAISIPYENKTERFAGRFIQVFETEGKAVQLAAAIARHAGMPVVEQAGEAAISILFEFMNTVAGKVITTWEGLGVVADFSTPTYLAEYGLQDENREAEIHLVTLILDQTTAISVFNIFEQRDERVLHDKRILVVDDSKMIRHLLTTEFEKQGCRVTEAENGLDAFVRNQADQPDLIIMDLVMPKMGGLEAIAQIREMRPAVPIIVLTSSSKKEEVMAAAAHKVKGYVIKPIQMDQLLELARSCFR